MVDEEPEVENQTKGPNAKVKSLFLRLIRLRNSASGRFESIVQLTSRVKVPAMLNAALISECFNILKLSV